MKNKRSLPATLSAKIKTTFILLCLSASLSTYAQDVKDFGVGTFTLQILYYPTGVFSLDSIAYKADKRIYHVKHSKVINRQVGPEKKIPQDTSKKVTKTGELEVGSTMTATFYYPTYLADYKNEEYFMYFENSKKSAYYRDSLKNHPEDHYKPGFTYKQHTLTKVKGGETTIAGKRCSLLLAIKETDTARIYYTKEKLDFVSPLNKPGITDSILGFQVRAYGRAFGFFITDIREEDLPDKAFTLPATAQSKTRNEVFNISNSPK